MNIHLYHPVHFENWDWRNGDTGIGGSETCQIEVAKRLARRGHEVFSYAPLPKDCTREHLGVHWRKLEEADFTAPGLWIIFRNPKSLDKFEPKRPDQQIWIMCQDEEYPGQWNEERAEKIDLVMALCKAHQANLAKNHPEIANKIIVTSNGVKMELIREIDKENLPRNPKKLVYASSPDRGLASLLKIFWRAREYQPDLELHCFYGFNNIDKLLKMGPQFNSYKSVKEELNQLMQQPNVFWHGRVSQKELLRHWATAGIFLYATNFRETSCISIMEAQAMGAIPIVSPVWALDENTRGGRFVEGDINEPLTKARFVGELVKLARDPKMQDHIREPMMDQTRKDFNWERWVDHWEALMFGFAERPHYGKLNYQQKHLKGETLIVACGVDEALLYKLPATNLDAPGVMSRAQILAPISGPWPLAMKFDTIILNDITERFVDFSHLIQCLKEATRLLRSADSRIVITIPNETSVLAQDLLAWLKPDSSKAGDFTLEVVNYEQIDNTTHIGCGLVVKA